MENNLDYKKNMLKCMAELNFYAIVDKIDKINNIEDLKDISDKIEKESCLIMNNICLCHG